MVFPLGLGHRFFRLPLMTFALIGLLFAIHFSTSKWREDYSKQIIAIRTSDRYLKASTELLLDYCQAKPLAVDVCGLMLIKFKEELVEDGEVKPIAQQIEKAKKKKQQTDKVRALASDKKEAAPDVERKAMVALQEFFPLFMRAEKKLTKLPNYPKYAAEKAKVDALLAAHYKRNDLLSGSSFSFVALFKAEFLHAGMLHLLGNCFVLLIFGAYVELRIGSMLFLGIYMLSGTLGLMIESFIMPKEVFIVGASANITGALGLFYALFFHHKMRFFVYDLIVKRKVYLPIQIWFPILFVGADLVGSLEELTGGGSDSVAHLAHFIGLMCGAAFGYWHIHKYPVSKSFLYAEDETVWKELSASLPETPVLLEKANAILSHNVHNLRIRKEMFECLLSRHKQGESSPEIAKFFEDNLALYVEGLEERGLGKEVLSFLALIPKHLAFNGAFKWLPQKALLFYGETAFRRGNFSLAILLFLQFIETFPKSKKVPDVLRSVQTLAVKLSENEKNELLPLVTLAKFPAVLNWLDQYFKEMTPADKPQVA